MWETSDEDYKRCVTCNEIKTASPVFLDEKNLQIKLHTNNNPSVSFIISLLPQKLNI